MKMIKDNIIDINVTAGVLFNKYLNTKRVSRALLTEDDFKRVLETIACVNVLSEDDTKLGEYLLTDYKIPKCFESFIYPARVSLGADRRYPDLRVRRSVSEFTPLNLTELADFRDKLGSGFKTSDIPVVSFGNRMVKTLNECREAMINYNGESRVISCDDTWFVPVGLKEEINSCVGTLIYNEDADWVFKQFLAQFKFVAN